MSGLAGQAIGIAEQLTAIGQDSAINPNSRGSMEPLIGFSTDGKNYDPAPTDFNVEGDTVTAAFDGSTRYFPEYIGNELSWASAVPADGVLFDTSRGDSFIDGFTFTPDDGVVVTDTSVIFDSDTDTSVTMYFRNDLGVVLEAYDSFEITFEMTIRSGWPVSDTLAWIMGFRSTITNWFGVATKSHPGAAGNAFAVRYMNGTPFGAASSSAAVGGGISAIVTVSLKQGVMSVLGIYDDVEVISLVSNMTMGNPVDAYELPRMFSYMGIEFINGHVTLTGVKIAVDFPNSKYALIGDSITQGRFASIYPEGYAMDLRGGSLSVLSCGAPGAKIADWTDPSLAAVFAMNPEYAIVFLGTNDLVFDSETVAKANYDALTAKIISAGIKVISIGIPPFGNYKAPLFNDLLEQTYSRYIDCYSPLLGTGTAMNPAYDSGDGIHPNSAGHALIASTIEAALISNGWV